MEFEHQRFGKCELKELTQKNLEDFHRDMKGKQNEPLSVWRGDSVRVMAKIGVLIEPVWKAEDVDNAKPAHVIWLSDCITALLSEAMNIDPLS